MIIIFAVLKYNLMQGQTLGLETDAEALALGRYIQEANVTNV